MQYTTLGRTGLTVSVAGLGCGGSSRLGRTSGKSESESINLVRDAMALGVNFFDTAAAYGTEEIVGKAIKGRRDDVVLSTKCLIRRQGELLPADAIVASLETSLRNLQTDCVDIFHFHGVAPKYYGGVRDKLVPVLQKEQAKGKFRHLGITETGPNDHGHEMLLDALPDGLFDVVMLAFHMMNQNARDAVLPRTKADRVGTLIMFAVRQIFSDPAYLAETAKQLIAEGQLPKTGMDPDNPLSFLLHPDGAASVVDAAYRYVRHQPGVDVVLFGTGSPAHLKSNIDSILAPPLPDTDVATLHKMFGHLRGVGLDLPVR